MTHSISFNGLLAEELRTPRVSTAIGSIIIIYLGLVVFIFRITVSAIYLALWLLFTLCMFELHYSVDLNKLNDDDNDDDIIYIK